MERCRERLTDGREVESFALTSAAGVELRLTSYGAILVELRTPDRHGVLEDIVLGHDSAAGYARNSPYFGAVIGRYANRIAGARFELDGQLYRLAANEGPNALHGGRCGFDQALWDAMPFEQGGECGVLFTLCSADGDQGFPGRLDVRVRYGLSDDGVLRVDYEARTDRPTVVNLTQHSYFNLEGQAAGEVNGHVVTIDADRYLPVDAALIPSGERRPVIGSRFDFRAGRTVHADRYDHNWVLRDAPGALRFAARAVAPVSGRTLELHTTEPGLQFYTGDQLDGSIVGKRGHAYPPRAGFVFEPQHFPDSPHQPQFPSTVLRPGDRFRSASLYRFGSR